MTKKSADRASGPAVAMDPAMAYFASVYTLARSWHTRMKSAHLAMDPATLPPSTLTQATWLKHGLCIARLWARGRRSRRCHEQRRDRKRMHLVVAPSALSCCATADDALTRRTPVWTRVPVPADVPRAEDPTWRGSAEVTGAPKINFPEKSPRHNRYVTYPTK